MLFTLHLHRTLAYLARTCTTLKGFGFVWRLIPKGGFFAWGDLSKKDTWLHCQPKIMVFEGSGVCTLYDRFVVGELVGH